MMSAMFILNIPAALSNTRALSIYIGIGGVLISSARSGSSWSLSSACRFAAFFRVSLTVIELEHSRSEQPERSMKQNNSLPWK